MRRYYKEKKEGNSFIRTLIMLLLLIVLILLSILILLYAKNSTEAMKQELYRKTQLATEQAGSNVDNISGAGRRGCIFSGWDDLSIFEPGFRSCGADHGICRDLPYIE